MGDGEGSGVCVAEGDEGVGAEVQGKVDEVC